MRDPSKPLGCKGEGQKHRVELISPAKVQGARPDGFERNGQAWFVATELQSDLQVEVEATHFHLHKFPLLSRSGLLNRLVFESRDTEKDHIKLVDLPGGADAFELAAKFCYGVAVELTPSNVASLRCAAEYLEMRDDLEEGNLVTKTEAFLSFVVLASWKDSITVLQSCKSLLPWAESLQIVQRCSESIAWKACTDPKGIRWSYTGAASKKQSSPVCEAVLVADDLERTIPQDWWFEDICLLSVEYFVRVINAVKVKGARAELVGAAIAHYALKWLPGSLKDRSFLDESFKGFSRSPHRTVDDSFRGFGLPTRSPPNNVETNLELQINERMLLETILDALPSQRDSITCNFLLRLLRAANILQVDASHCRELERRIGSQLDQASLQDLLVLSSNLSSDTAFDVDVVYRIVQHFVLQDVPVEGNGKSPKIEHEMVITAARGKVAKLLDGYLAEVACDPKLPLSTFQTLIESLSEHARSCDDGLYKAIDNYFRSHPDLSDADRKKLCRSIDVHKLTLDACLHASQNDRLPLRMVVQVLFSEQVKLRNAITGGSRAASEERTPLSLLMQFARVSTSDSDPQSSRDGWSIPNMDFRALQLEVQQMRAEFMGLKSYCSGLQEQLDKVSKRKGLFSWGSSFKKLNSMWKSSNLVQQHNKSPSASRRASVEATSALCEASSHSCNGRRPTNRWRRNSVS
ncbi:hypothetical protein GOP47_0023000 [Adiantum capillus-veneris]|uniref:Uncharacterized protein n=1 Tax=Adiantum capillus-veneris TaxID=13818 RepID=A0A9D4U8T0_ADICA|nr:hypothetical protein GOP47_0023000 [Adiantum capillus-veneris]